MASLGVVLAYLAAVVAPAPDRYEDVQIGSVTLRIPFPDGYCRPTGTDAASFEGLAQADRDNFTLLSLVECTPTPAARYFLVKTPRRLVNQDVGRAEAIRGLSAAIARPEFAARVNSRQSHQEIGESKSRALGVETTVEGEIGPRGHDDVCVYIAGLMTTATAESSQTQTAASCMTVAGRRLFSLNSYENSTDPNGYKAHLPLLKGWAETIAPPPGK